MSLPEVLLWNQLKQDQIGFHIRRQFQFDGFILDFYCAELHVDIEVDGKIHQLRLKEDANRDAALTLKGVTTIRIAATSVLKSPSDVAEYIRITLEELRSTRTRDES
jgi:very-short-patch-repair endonuclease